MFRMFFICHEWNLDLKKGKRNDDNIWKRKRERDVGRDMMPAFFFVCKHMMPA